MLPMSYDEWVDAYFARVDANARSTLDTCNLVVTFNSAIAAGLVAAAYQVAGSEVGTIRVATGLLAFAVVLGAIVLLALNQIDEPDVARMESDASEAGATEDQLFSELRQASGEAALRNRENSALATQLGGVQTLLSLCSAAMATWSLLSTMA